MATWKETGSALRAKIDRLKARNAGVIGSFSDLGKAEDALSKFRKKWEDAGHPKLDDEMS